MPTLEERVAFLEGRSGKHSGAIAEVRLDVRELRAEMIRRFEHVDRRLDHVDNRFNWLVGLQFATLLSVIAALLNFYYR